MFKSFAAVVVVVASARLAMAQTGLGDIPECARPCLQDFLGGNQIAGCPPLDVACICGNNDFLGEIACCLINECDAQQQRDTIAFAHNICRTAQITNLPNEIVCSTATAAATAATEATTAATEATTAAPSGTGSAVTEAPSSTSSDAAADSQQSSTPNAGPIPTMAPAGILGGVIAVAAALL